MDLSEAYDTTNYRMVILKIDTTKNGPLCKVIQNMMSSRRFYVELNKRSLECKQHYDTSKLMYRTS